MGLAIRIIPTLLKRGPHLVKGQRFSADRVVGHVQQAARIHQARGVDELIILDVDATPSGRGPDFAAVEELTRDCFMPLTVGGGVRSVEDCKRLFDSGADKVAICSAALELDEYHDFGLIRECSNRFGCQAIVAAVDHVGPAYTAISNGMIRSVYTACHLARRYAQEGAGEILLTSIANEGTMRGLDIETIERVCKEVDIPVIAHGGCSGPEDMLRAIEAGASAVAAGALFQFTDHTPRSCAQWLHERGVEVRV